MKQVIAYIRETDLITDELLESYVLAQQIQISRDFAPLWSIDAVCIAVRKGAPLPPDATMLVRFQDHSPEPGALGFHDDQGRPIAYVFVGDDLKYGVSWTVTASHETLEMLVDPTINRTRTRTLSGVTWEYMVEVCDAPEDDSFGYWVEGRDHIKHLMSAFVTPSWFDENGKGPFAFPTKTPITEPWQLLQGGYIGRVEIAPATGQWTQLTAQQGPRSVKKWYSRTKRRMAA